VKVNGNKNGWWRMAGGFENDEQESTTKATKESVSAMNYLRAASHGPQVISQGSCLFVH
jgi:hypothetical protein